MVTLSSDCVNPVRLLLSRLERYFPVVLEEGSCYAEETTWQGTGNHRDQMS